MRTTSRALECFSHLILLILKHKADPSEFCLLSLPWFMAGTSYTTDLSINVHRSPLFPCSLASLSWRIYTLALHYSSQAKYFNKSNRPNKQWDHKHLRFLPVKFILGMFRPQKCDTNPNKTHESLYPCQGLKNIGILRTHLLDQSPFKICWSETECYYIERPLTGPDCTYPRLHS